MCGEVQNGNRFMHAEAQERRIIEVKDLTAKRINKIPFKKVVQSTIKMHQ